MNEESEEPRPDERQAPADPRQLDTMILIEEHRGGNREALDELFRRYAERVRRIVRVRMGAFLRSRAQVEDVVQETLLRAFQSLDRYEQRADAKLIDWMARIAENALRNLFSEQMAEKRNPGREVAIESLRDKAHKSSIGWDLMANSASIPEKLSRQEMEQIVDECLAELPDKQREVILLVDYAKGDWEFVTARIDRPTPAAAQQFHRRARVALAAKVERRLRK